MFKTFLFFLISYNLLAEDVIKSGVCPSITSEANSIINSIQGLKNQLKSYPECQPINEKLSVVSSIMTGDEWTTIKKVLTEGSNFEGDDVTKVAELTERASFALNDVIGQLTNNRKCVDEKNQSSFMAKLSGVVKEVSTIIGTVAGPYGMPVALGGTLVTSAITGIDKFYKSQHPYKFSNPDDELLFMNQFCSYAEIQKDINDYLNLDVRVEELESLENYLKIKQSDLENNCPECKAEVLAFKVKEKSELILKRITEDANIVDSDKDLDKVNYTRCNEINRAIYSNDSDLNQFFKLLSTYSNPMSSASDMSQLKDLAESSIILKTNYPKLTECWSLPLAEKQVKSRDFNAFLRDEILPLGNTFFGQQINTFKMTANKKYVNPLGDWTEKTLLRRKWIVDEYNIVKAKLNDPNYGTSVQMIISRKKQLESRIFDDLTIDYLKFLKKRNLNQLDKFTEGYKDFVKKSLKDYSSLLHKKINSVEEILNELNKATGIDKRPFLSLLKDQRNELDLTITETMTLDRYCHFMNYMLLTTDDSVKTCSSAKAELTEGYKVVSSLDNLTSAYLTKKLSWLVNDGNFQSSRVKDFSIHLRDWLATGIARWETRTTSEDR